MADDSTTLLWFRQDLRLADNPALAAAIERGRTIFAVYVDDAAAQGLWPDGAAARWWRHHALASLREALAEHGIPLILRKGKAQPELDALIATLKVGAIYWNRRYEPACRTHDQQLKADLKQRGLEVRSFNGSLLFEPGTVLNRSGKPFQVFTPFWRHAQTLSMSEPTDFDRAALERLSPNRQLAGVARQVSLLLEELQLLPNLPWDGGFYDAWNPCLEGAEKRLGQFLSNAVAAYSEQRDLPAADGTSRLSPYLHHGQLSPLQVVSAAMRAGGVNDKFLAEVGWREFSYHLLFHFPQLPEQPLRPEFEAFPWAFDAGHLSAWQQGRTGYPIVDAGMRQLWTIGWMHNRVRMVVASLLVKHLLQPWQEGAAWFWDTLVDADLASNTQGWQWAAGCGADAAPYFRIFNPMTQGSKFDPSGTYVRAWVPELGEMPAKHIHAPWEAPSEVLSQAGVRLGETYPRPIIDHKKGRQRALDAFAGIKGR